MRRYYLWCPRAEAPEPPPIEQQVNEYADPIWSPNSHFCEFRSQSGGSVNFARWYDAPPRIRHLQATQLPNNTWTTPNQPEEFIGIFQREYRCATHHCPPEVFRTRTAVERRTNNLTNAAYERATLGYDRIETQRLEWPAHVHENYRYRRVMIYLPRYRVPTTHSIWS